MTTRIRFLAGRSSREKSTLSMRGGGESGRGETTRLPALSSGAHFAVSSLIILGVLLSALPAKADPSLLLSSSRVDSLPRAAAIGAMRLTTGLGVGGGVAFPWHERHAWGGEALLWTGSGVVETRGGVAWQLAKPGLFALSAQTGAAMYFVGRSAFDFGIGPELGLTAGLGRDRWEISLGAQTGLELFVRTGGPRLPVRALLQGRYGVGPIDVTLWTRAGADYEGGTYPTIRAEGGLLVGWRR